MWLRLDTRPIVPTFPIHRVSIRHRTQDAPPDSSEDDLSRRESPRIGLDSSYRDQAKSDPNYDLIRDDPAFRRLGHGE